MHIDKNEYPRSNLNNTDLVMNNSLIDGLLEDILKEIK